MSELEKHLWQYRSERISLFIYIFIHLIFFLQSCKQEFKKWNLAVERHAELAARKLIIMAQGSCVSPQILTWTDFNVSQFVIFYFFLFFLLHFSIRLNSAALSLTFLRFFWHEPKLEEFAEADRKHSYGWHKSWFPKVNMVHHLSPLSTVLFPFVCSYPSVDPLASSNYRNPLWGIAGGKRLPDRCGLIWRVHCVMVVETVATLALSLSMSVKRKMTHVEPQICRGS